ncbi:MAG TPA: hypothetical protein PK698_02295 [Bacilli bacterium]|nr:hypothetical protein [Bacilli bacterium]
MFDTIFSIRPFFFSLREIKENVSLDIKIPLSWNINPDVNGVDKDVSIKVQDENERNRLISIIGLATKTGYDAVFSSAKQIITYNQEIEEKNRLFNEKVEELKKFFLEAPIEKLKDISFTNEKHGVRNRKSTREAKVGNEEGSGSNESE